MVPGTWHTCEARRNPADYSRDLRMTIVTESSAGTTYQLSPKPTLTGECDCLEVAMGPQHPSTHGVFRMDVVLEGERVVKLKPVFGYLHRNHEQIAEGASYLAAMPYTDRLDYFCSL